MRIGLVLASIVFVVNAVVVDACSCGVAARACKSSADCLAGEACVEKAGSTDRECAASVGEGEGETGEGEGVTGEGEGVTGEGEGEGAAASCGNGVVETGEQCDDGNTDEKDLCTSTCTSTAVTVAPVLGFQALRDLPLFGAQSIGGSQVRGVAVAPGTGEIFYAPPSSTSFVRVDDDRPLERATLQGTSPTVVATTADERVVYFDGSGRRVHRLDPATGDDVVIAGDGSDNDVVDPPGFVFAAPTTVPFPGVGALDVDDSGVVFVGGDGRVVAIQTDGSGVVVAGAHSAVTGGTDAQRFEFNEVLGLSVDHNGGAASVLWIAALVPSDGLEVVRVDLPAGALTFERGTGTVCDQAPVSGCQMQARAVLDDGAGGFFAIGATPTGSAVKGAVWHVDSTSTVTTFALDDELQFPLSAAIVEGSIANGDAVLGLTRAFGTRLLLVHDATAAAGAAPVIERVGVPVPSKGIDRTLIPVESVAASDNAVFFATLSDLWSVDAAGALTHVAAVEDLAPCDNAVPIADGIAASSDGATLVLAQEGAHRVCTVDVATKSAAVLAPNVGGARHVALRPTDVLVAAFGNVVRVPLDGSATTNLITNAPSSPIAVASTAVGDGAQVLFQDGSRAFIGAPPSNTVTNAGAGSLGDALGLVARNNNAGVVYDPQTHAVDVIDGTGAVTSPLAGGSANAGFLDGDAASALFDPDVFALAGLLDGTIVVASSTAIRLVQNNVVTTVVGSDQLEEDGDVAIARLGATSSLSCSAHRCIAADPSAHNVRVVDFDTARVDRVAGSEGHPLANLDDAVFLDDGTVLWADGSALNITDLASPDAAPSHPMTGQFVGAPTLVASLGNGQLAFFDGASIKAGPANPRTLGTPSSAPAAIAYDSARDVVVSVTSSSPATIEQFAVSAQGTAPAPLSLDASFGAGRALAVDDQSNVYVGTDEGVVQLFAAGSRTLATRLGSSADATVTTPLLPFAGTIGALAVENGDVLVADKRTGALVRIQIQ